MLTPSRRSSALMAGLLSLLALPLCAQLNPKWQTINSPDFLNLYQQSNATTLKPEIVTVFDFSGSMQTIMYDKRLNPITDGADGTRTINFTLTRAGGGPPYTYTCAAALTAGYTLTNGTLIRPDGTAVTAALIDANYVAHSPALNGEGVTPKAGDVRNWIRSASHVRFSTLVGADTRTVDVPIPWTILDELNIGVANPAMTMYNTYPLKMTIKDPVSNTEVELDSRYLVGNTMVNSTGVWNTNQMTGTIPNVAYQNSYVSWLFNGKDTSGKYWIPDTNAGMNSKTVDGTPRQGFANGVPSRTRTQAVKDAALRVWTKYYDKVYWAYRFLNNSGANQEGGTPGSLSSDTKNYLPAAAPANPPTAAPIGGGQRGWRLMNNHSLDSMRLLAVYSDSGTTPLNTALANAYAQFSDPDSVFNEVEIAPNDTPQECMKHFVILFTDGQPNTETGNDAASTASPYITAMTGSVQPGNAVFAADKTQINPRATNSYFNILNLSALAAHGGDSSQPSHIPTPTYPGNTTYPAGRQAADTWLPFWVRERNGTNFNPAHPIQTMTVGVSLAGAYNAVTSPKYRMFAAACLGDPALKTWNLGTLKPFELVDPANPLSAKNPDSVYFFDATDPQTLVAYLDKAFAASTALSQNNATAAPVLPTVGTGLGAAVYLSKFAPPSEGGPIWPGDLLMYPIREDSAGISRLLDSSGTPVIGADLADPSKAQWAATAILATKLWFNRNIYTRVASTSTAPQPPMTKVRVQSSDTYTLSDAGYLAIKPLLPGGTDAAKFDNWRHFVGAAMPVSTVPPATRSNVMGDVVNSAPAVMEYSELPATVASASPALGAAWAAHGTDNRMFRVIFVGTNQGVMHAFGEVSWDQTVANGTIQTGVADELWAFAPTDLLPYIDYYRNSGNTHRFGVDGSPTAYLLDLPPLGSVRGNGSFDIGSTKERATVIFGLGKGGRSYYAIDVRDPANPTFQEANATYGTGKGWSLCPDEPFNYQATRFQAPASSASIPTITNMGLSTSVPMLSRVVVTAGKLVKDLVLLGGGFSVPEIEGNLPLTPAPAPNRNTHLGRSVVAVDVELGNILGVWDLTANNNVGPVSAGVIPHAFFQGTGFHQRAYFADFFGGIWALGYTGRDANDIRRDSSYMDDWATSPRLVYKQNTTEGLISTLPVPFAAPSMPTRTSTPFLSPAAVGIAFVTGDRDNPLDRFYTVAWPRPNKHRLNVIFDRQDSYLLGLDTNGIQTSDLASAGPPPYADLSAAERNPSDPSFYLRTKYGYYVSFPDHTTTTGGQWVPKGIVSPLLLGGRIFYSFFNPTDANPCTGGQGETNTFRIKNVMIPDATNTVVPALDKTGKSGQVLRWTGVASAFAIRSLMTGLQAGMSGGSGVNNNPNSTQNMLIQSLDTGSQFKYPGARVWRTVH